MFWVRNTKIKKWDPDRAAPAGVVWSGFILFAPILANTKNLFQVCAVDCHIGPDKDS